MTTVPVFPELFEPADSLFSPHARRIPEAEDPNASVNKFAASFEVPEDFEFLLRVLRKNTELRTALFKAVQEEESFPGCSRV
jgi:hypothetical protein